MGLNIYIEELLKIRLAEMQDIILEFFLLVYLIIYD